MSEQSARPGGDDAWYSAFSDQLTDELYADALRYARHLTTHLARVDDHADDQYAGDLVQAAIVDTWVGAVTWDPTCYTLLAHVQNTMKGRCHHDRDRALDMPHVQLDTCSATGVGKVTAQASASAEDEEDVNRRSAVYLAMLRDMAIAKRDSDVLLVLQRLGEGCFTPAEIASATGWRRKRIRNARKRLQGYIQALPLRGRPSRWSAA
jgi:hypothetical protein